MASSPSNVKLGPCSVTWDGVDLGYTKGGVEVEITTSKKKVMVDQFGETEIDEYITGRNVVVRCPFAETDLTKFEKFIPSATLLTDGVTATKKKVNVASGVGVSLLEVAALLVLHPIANEPTEKNDDFNVPLAAPSGDISFAYKVDDERVYNVEFTGYADEDGLLFVFGDMTADPEPE